MCFYGDELYHAQVKIKFTLCYIFKSMCLLVVLAECTKNNRSSADRRVCPNRVIASIMLSWIFFFFSFL